jgi:RNA polymerase sigma factor (TIGR02999 family)
VIEDTPPSPGEDAPGPHEPPAAPDDPDDQVTALLREAGAGKPGASEEFLRLVYDQLRGIARSRMAGERTHHTLRATELVHEAWLKLGRQVRERDWQSRGQFFAAAAEAMRRILIDYARRRGSTKREGSRQRVLVGVIDLAEEQDPDWILAVDDAIARLEKEDARLGQIVRLRFYAGLSLEDTARSMNLSPRTVHRDWTFARAWLFDALRDELGSTAPD